MNNSDTHTTQRKLQHPGERLTEGTLKIFFETAVKHEASDMLIKPGKPTRLRLHGELRTTDLPVLEDDQLEQMITESLPPELLKQLNLDGSVDLAFSMKEDARFRLNIYRSVGRYNISARRVSSVIHDFKTLNLPAKAQKLTEFTQGLVLLCGVTGSGKSSTIAAILNQISQTRRCHIVTLEDPIEYLIPDDKASVSQREIGVDVPDFELGLRALVREDPDVVLIGELRDRDTLRGAMQAAETGHLVMGTVHASSVTGVFSRIYSLFPKEERDHVRHMLSMQLQAIMYQKLLPTMSGDPPRVPAVELMINTPPVQKAIREATEHDIPSIISDADTAEMIDLHQYLVELVRKQYIHPRVAQSGAHSPDRVRMLLKGFVQSS